MVRRIPAHRFRDLVETASEVFIESGYRRTQMADVARELGLGKGTLYGYVQGKDALFYLALAYADREVPAEVPANLPIPNPAPGAMLELVRERLDEQGEGPRLAAALDRPVADDVGVEFEAILRELYAMLRANRTGLKLMDRCAVEIDELALPWRSAGRRDEMARLERYLDSRMEAGQIVRFASPSIAARILLETVTTWAVHIHWDRMPEKIDERAAQETVVSVLRRGFVVEE